MECCASVRRKEARSGRIIWIVNEENDWDRNVEGDAVEGPVVCVIREEVLQASNKTSTGKATGPTDVSWELIAASGGV